MAELVIYLPPGSILKIITLNNSILLNPCEKVIDFDLKLHSLLDEMAKIMYEAPGVGLAAPQVSINKQIFVMDSQVQNKSKGKLYEVINPVIVHQEGNISSTEGCLSIPGHTGTIFRSEQIQIKFQDRYGNEKEMVAFGFEATIVQHEIDHLFSKVYIHRLPRQQRRSIERDFK